MILNREINNKLNEVKNALKLVGFLSEDIDRQITKLGEVVLMAIILRVARENPHIKNLPLENLEKYLDENLKNSYLTKIIEEESGAIMGEYLKEITKNLPEDKRNLFFARIQQIQ